MPLMDIIQWADNSKRSGTLILHQEERQKKFYLQDGQIIFVWSDSVGERIADFLQFEIVTSQQKLNEALTDSEYLGLPYIGYLYSEQIVSKTQLEEVLRQVAEAALIDALKWETGTFEFVDELPSFVLNGPVKLNSTQILLESVQSFDENSTKKPVNSTRIIGEIKDRIERGNLELPPIPDIMQRIAEELENPLISIDEIVTCLTDQILVSKILRICNSPYYWHDKPISSLKEAVVFIGIKSLMSIVTVHALSSFSPRNADEIRKVLQHCLVCGMIARQISCDMQGNYEQAFICGLLHDIGKTVMLDLISDYLLTDEVRAKLIEEHHAEIGYLLAEKWNFGEDIKEAIRYHHAPELAVMHKNLVEVVFLSNIMAHSNCRPSDIGSILFSSIDVSQVNDGALVEQIDMLDQDARSIVSLG